MAPKPEPGPVQAAIEHDIDQMAEFDPELRKSFLAASALRMAAAMDRDDLGPREISNLSRELRETMEDLRAVAPRGSGERRTRLDELGAARARRRSGG